MSIYQGIDIGSHKIKKITIETRWNKYKAVNENKSGKKIITVPSNFLTFRSITFPFQDKKRILEILPGELIDSIAFSINNIKWDISSIEKDNVNTFIVPKDFLDKFIQENGNSNSAIDVEPCALVRVARYNKIDNALIIDFGAKKTSFYGLVEGRINLVRVRLAGGDKLDQLISLEEKISIEEAENIKIEKGLNLKSIKKYINSIINSISLPSPFTYKHVIITGGGSLLPGLKEYIEEKWKVPVDYFSLPSNFSPHFDAVAFGAAIYDGINAEKVNFRKKKETSSNNIFIWALFIILFPLIIFSINLKIKENQLKNENKKIMNAMTSAIRKEFPKIGRLTSPLSQVKAKIKKKKKNLVFNISALKVLSDISKARKVVTVNFYEIDINDEKIKLKGESSSFKDVDTLKNSLKKFFKKVNVVNQATKPGGKVDFYIKLETKPNG